MQAFDRAIELNSAFAAALADRGLIKIRNGLDGDADIKRAFAINPGLHREYDSQLQQARQVGEQVHGEEMNERILAGAMQQWINARTQAQLQAAFAPWLQYGQIKTAEIHFYDNLDNYVTLTFPAVEIWVKPFTNRLQMQVWVPIRQADANAIPKEIRIPLLAPPGAAALQPTGYFPDQEPFFDILTPTGQTLDSLYLEKLNYSKRFTARPKTKSPKASTEQCCDCGPELSDRDCFLKCNALLPRCTQ